MIDTTKPWDLIIIGGGAAGLMAATSAGRFGYRTLLIEKNNKLGVKILMSGGTRCNITQNCDRRGIVEAFGEQGNFLQSALTQLPPEDVIAEIEAQGVPTKIESTGKIFPSSDRAIDVRDALVRMAEQANAVLQPGCAVLDVKKSQGEFQVDTQSGSYRSKSVLITTGGKSYPGCGTTGDGYVWARKFGHSIVPPVPALTPILVNDAWAQALKGLTIPDVNVQISRTNVLNTGGATKPSCLNSARGSFLFTHFGFSGPAVLNVSRTVTQSDNKKELRLVCDWLPEIPHKKMPDFLNSELAANGKQSLLRILSRITSRRLAESLLELNQISAELKAAETGKQIRQQIIQSLKQTAFAIPGTLGFEKAEVTAGGVERNEVSSKTLQSKIMPGLYFAGEVLDLDGPIGGYNFQSAFSTGYVAGQILGS